MACGRGGACPLAASRRAESLFCCTGTAVHQTAHPVDIRRMHRIRIELTLLPLPRPLPDPCGSALETKMGRASFLGAIDERYASNLILYIISLFFSIEGCMGSMVDGRHRAPGILWSYFSESVGSGVLRSKHETGDGSVNDFSGWYSILPSADTIHVKRCVAVINGILCAGGRQHRRRTHLDRSRSGVVVGGVHRKKCNESNRKKPSCSAVQTEGEERERQERASQRDPSYLGRWTGCGRSGGGLRRADAVKYKTRPQIDAVHRRRYGQCLVKHSELLFAGFSLCIPPPTPAIE